MAKSTAWFTGEDAKMAFNLFCCVYGVGTLGMPGNFSRAGPALAIIAMIFMAFANIYASVVCSKVMLLAPRTVKTFGDLGEWCMGTTGRWLIVISHTLVCILVPCLYLVLGGTILPGLFPLHWRVVHLGEQHDHADRVLFHESNANRAFNCGHLHTWTR